MTASVTSLDSLEGLATELQAAGLPVSDIYGPNRRFFRFDDDAGLVGYCGIEGTGADRLLRSFVIQPDRRGLGLGAAMLASIERIAGDDGVTCLYLLTDTVEPFFRRHGYDTARRAEAPTAIAGSSEFRLLCPASATFLSKRIA